MLKQIINALVVETHAVDQCLPFRQAKQPRQRITHLWPGSHRAHLQKTKAQGREPLDTFAIFVKTGCHTDRIGKLQSHQFYRLFYPGLQERVPFTQTGGHLQGSNAQVMGRLRIKLKQQGA